MTVSNPANIDIISKIEVTRLGSQSSLTSCRSVAPLKILNPHSSGDYCSAILSSYGGGVVEGDSINLAVRCRKQAQLYLGTQSFTKIYKNPRGLVSRQTIHGTIEAGACVAVLPDPIVPQAESIFHQEQQWDLENNSLLILLDWYTAGRSERGEQFAYKSYASSLTITVKKRLVLVERLNLMPQKIHPATTGLFDNFLVGMNIYVTGSSTNNRFTQVLSHFKKLLDPIVTSHVVSPTTRQSKSLKVPGTMVSYALAKPEVFIIRALGRSTEHLSALYNILGSAVALPQIFGSNPLKRKL